MSEKEEISGCAEYQVCLHVCFEVAEWVKQVKDKKKWIYMSTFWGTASEREREIKQNASTLMLIFIHKILIILCIM